MRGKIPQRFRKLEIWQRSMDFVSEIYRVTEKFPQDEKYGLTSQLRRAAVSVSLNIAEGSGSGSDKDFARYLGISLSSVYEVICGLDIAVRLGHCESDTVEKLMDEADEIAAMISGFILRLNGGRSAASCKLPAASLR